METMGQYASRLERENSEKQARINNAVRDLDNLIARLATTAWTDTTQKARNIQANLRGRS